MKKLFKSVCIFLAVIIGAVIVYGWHLSARIEKRFSSRLWRIPSTVYSDTTLLYPGQRFGPAHLREKLSRLRYSTVSTRPQKKGEVRFSTASAEIYLNDFSMPNQNRPGSLVRIRFNRKVIKSIEQVDDRNLLPILELEPEEIGQFYGPKRQRRQLVSIRQVPNEFIHAVLAAEDGRFYDHHGFDPIGILRALYVNLRYGEIRQGGSTITQQLAKNFFLTPERTFSRKLNELILSVIIEWMYEKDQILEIYLNDIYLGQSGSVAINGVGEATTFYFGKNVERISLAEAATIAGLIRAPGRYSPYSQLDRCRQRRDDVLKAMRARNWISVEELDTARSQPVRAVAERVSVKKAPYFLDYLSQQLEALYSSDDLTRLGLSIFTTLDTRVQSAAEQALIRGLNRLEQTLPSLKRPDPTRQLQGAVVVLQPKTGFILAMVGGRDYNTSQYNRVVQSRRQPGSAFKPFVYLAALDALTPVSRLSSVPQTYQIDGKPWTPENFSKDTEMDVSMRAALATSNNRATVDMAMRVGLESIVDQVARFHFTTPIQPYPSLALGAFEVFPLELARAYCAFAGDGVLPYPLSLKDVTDDHGQVLNQRHLNIENLITPAKAYIVTDMLRSVVTDGTARALGTWNLPRSIAGKTGTTNNFRDAWFVGYTPDILGLVWVGFDNGDSIDASGSKAALPIWADLMTSIPDYLTGADFRMPEGVVRLRVCSESGLLAEGRRCPRPVEELFEAEKQPDRPCPIHPAQGPLKVIIDGLKGLINPQK
jgi:penicillin-binding protein 1B